MRRWERRHLARSGRVLALVYAVALVLACAALIALSGWSSSESTGWAALRGALRGLILAGVTGVGAVGCLSMAFDRRIPAGVWLIGLLPAVVRAVWILAA
jgi:hypothetical protein